MSWAVSSSLRFLPAYMLLGLVLGYRLGQDANWDLQNYHFYNVYMLLGGRFETDVQAAGIQTYLNPVFDIPVYIAIVWLGVPPIVVGLTLSALHGTALWLVHRIVFLLMPGENAVVNNLAGLVAAVTAAYGANFYAEIGSTMADDTFAVLVLGAILSALAVVSADERAVRRSIRVSGFLLGLAAGGKLVAGIYGFGLVLACLALRGDRWTRLRHVRDYCGFLLIGLAVTGGYWMWLMQRHFDSPLFPFYNAWFKSSFAPIENFTDARYQPRTWMQAVFYPFLLTSTENIADPYPWRDARLAVSYVCVALLPLAAWARSVKGVPVIRDDRERRLIMVSAIWAGSYAVWLYVFSLYRYAVPLEALAGALVIGAAAYLTRSSLKILAIATPVCLALILFARPFDWGRRPWSQSLFGVDRSAVRQFEDATILLWDMPNGYIIPFFPESARFLRLNSNWGLTEETRLWSRLARDIAMTPAEQMYFVETSATWQGSDKSAMLGRFRLEIDRGRCTDLVSFFGVHRICGVTRATR